MLRFWRGRTSRPVRSALLAHRTPNLGDDIQALAARPYWPRIDYHVDRDHLGGGRAAGPLALILNGWFMHRHAGRFDWPPPPNVRPLLVSFHASDPRLVTDPDARRFYRQHQPVGCRDYHTLELFRSQGIDAYYSGCLTLTLQSAVPRRRDRIVFCDPFGPAPGWRYFCPGEPEFRTDLWERVPPAVRQQALFVSHRVDPATSPEARAARARELLDLYARARLVVTSRLHCALPCLAFGTPVVFLRPEPDPRFEGLLDLMTWHPLAALERGALPLDFEAPPANPVDVSPLAASLAARCRTFVARQLGAAPVVEVTPGLPAARGSAGE